MELSSPFILTCLASIALFFLLHKLNNRRPVTFPAPAQAPNANSKSEFSSNINLPFNPPQEHPTTRFLTTKPHEEDQHHHHRHLPIHPQLLWIPFPSLNPPTTSLQGRKGSFPVTWQDDSSEDSNRGMEMIGDGEGRRNSSLLSGVGAQFTAATAGESLGRRRLSWFIWDGVVGEDRMGGSTCTC